MGLNLSCRGRSRRETLRFIVELKEGEAEGNSCGQVEGETEGKSHGEIVEGEADVNQPHH